MTREQISYYVNVGAFVIVIAMWLVLVWSLIARRKKGTAPHASHERRSWIGFGLQIASFPIIGSVVRTPLFSPIVDGQFTVNIFVQMLAIALIMSSVVFEISAFKELGKQWSLQARVLEGHELIKTGVYSVVRHPIYTALFARLIATGLTYSHWIALSVAIVIFLIGTKIRIVSEDRLLEEAFGEEFSTWKSKVPGLIPFIRI